MLVRLALYDGFESENYIKCTILKVFMCFLNYSHCLKLHRDDATNSKTPLYTALSLPNGPRIFFIMLFFLLNNIFTRSYRNRLISIYDMYLNDYSFVNEHLY